MKRALGRGAVRPRYDATDDTRSWQPPPELGLEDALRDLERVLDEWSGSVPEEIREMVRYQLAARAKRFRPLVLFACHAAAGGERREDVLRVAAAVELFHNYATVLNDIVDRNRVRRGKLALHCRYGRLPAIMVSGYFSFAAGDMLADDEFLTTTFAELGMRFAATECRQWNLRGEPFGLATWQEVVAPTSGAVFEACARIGTRDDSLAEFGRLLGMLYHGAEDVGDVRVALAAPVSAERELTDRVLTLPAALATEDQEVAALFAADAPEAEERLRGHLLAALPDAEGVLDDLAREAADAARGAVERSDVLVGLVGEARALSRVSGRPPPAP